MAQLVVSILTILIMIHVILLGVAYSIFLERKISAWIQNRIGPNRTNFSFGILPFKGTHFGLGQSLADGAKMLFKEDYTPPYVDKALFTLAPMVAAIPAMLVWAIIPWGGYLVCDGFTWPAWFPFVGGTSTGPWEAIVAAAPINIGIVYPLAIGSVGVYGVVLAGYSSNNKYSFLGGLRATAQMLSYEIPMGLCVLAVLLMAGTTRADMIVTLQAEHSWFIFQQPLLAVIFFACVLAECNRAPFDLAECEQELVGGFHTEYSSMRMGLFFLGEYMHVIGGCAFFALLFLGGWDIVPFIGELPLTGGIFLVLLKVGVYISKVVLLVALTMWIRWTIPRFRFDQLMKLAWRGLIPITLAMLLVTGLLVALKPAGVAATAWHWLLLPANVLVYFAAMIIGPRLPQGPPVNRRIGLEGSRFSPPKPMADV